MSSDTIGMDLGKLWETIRAKLQEKGIDVDFCCDPGKAPHVKVVCVSPDLQQSVKEMGQSTRDQVLMVRVTEATLRDLDAWVATGAVKSRSEAAALFICEGLKLRAEELSQLRDALKEVEDAQERLKTRAREIFKGTA